MNEESIVFLMDGFLTNFVAGPGVFSEMFRSHKDSSMKVVAHRRK